MIVSKRKMFFKIETIKERFFPFFRLMGELKRFVIKFHATWQKRCLFLFRVRFSTKKSYFSNEKKKHLSPRGIKLLMSLSFERRL